MAEPFELTVEPRQHQAGKAGKKLRRQGLLPGVLYGYNVSAPQAIQVDERTFERIYHRAGNVHLVDLHIGETGGVSQALIHGVTRDPLTHSPTHIDFLAVNPREEITAHVPITLTGESPAVRNDIGVLLLNLPTLTVRVLPTATPEGIPVDVSGMEEVGATLYVKDLTVPGGVTVLDDPDEVVAHVAHVRVVPEEEAEAMEAATAEAEAAEAAGEAAGEEEPATES